LFALLALSGCIHGKLPPQEFYRLRVPEPTDSIAAVEHDGNTPQLPAGGIAIVPYIAPGLYGDRGIVFRINDTEYGSYPNRAWALPLPTMLGMLTEDVFRGRPLTRDLAVFDPPSPHAYAYVWRGVVRELEEVDRGNQVFAAVRLEARLMRARDDSVLWSGGARLERPVPEATMPAIVAALSQLTIEVITQLQETARAALVGPAASAVRPPLGSPGGRP
jgi:cholesterol transport system auxiliary component